MAVVYWIHLDEHTDLFTQGYIGVTTKTAEERFEQHCNNAFWPSIPRTKLYNVIRKYGAENLIVETLVVSDKEYAYDLEYKLRPNRNIGWNLAIGGSVPQSLKGKKHSEASKEKMRKAKLGKKQSQEHIDKYVNARMAKPCWERGNATEWKWEYADFYYIAWYSCKSHQLLSRRLDFKRGTFDSMFNNFDRGYCPLTDELWRVEFLNTRQDKTEEYIQRLKDAHLFIPIGFVVDYLEELRKE